ncbi:hypothetical protein FQN50_003965 [Emmonsiellopsis sp. PD_5]|nr:hypothetical protein FQN50_003965 [Emmonsiellopsis sp. PD_5]
MHTPSILLALSAAAGTALAHIEMTQPPAFRSRYGPDKENIDYSNTSPLLADGSNFPCKGYHLDNPTSGPVATYAAGSTNTLKLTGTATHGGGSCQLSLSYDNGKTFKVIKSIIGGCPSDKKEYEFMVPESAPEGNALFAWTWFNLVGNREMYMNCARVRIEGGAGPAKGYKREGGSGNGTSTSASASASASASTSTSASAGGCSAPTSSSPVPPSAVSPTSSPSTPPSAASPTSSASASASTPPSPNPIPTPSHGSVPSPNSSPGSGSSGAFDDLPEIFVANVGNGETTVEGKVEIFEEPGDDVAYGGGISARRFRA